MEKTKLTRFIEKYHLGGNVNAVVINSDNSKLSTRFITFSNIVSYIVTKN